MTPSTAPKITAAAVSPSCLLAAAVVEGVGAAEVLMPAVSPLLAVACVLAKRILLAVLPLPAVAAVTMLRSFLLKPSHIGLLDQADRPPDRPTQTRLLAVVVAVDAVAVQVHLMYMLPAPKKVMKLKRLLVLGVR